MPIDVTMLEMLWRHNRCSDWKFVCAGDYFDWSKYFRFPIVPTLYQVQVFLFCKQILRFFLFFLKIAKRVKENKRLSNFRNIACQLVTEIGQTCGIGLIVSNQRLILFCIIQMTFFKNKFAEYSVYPHKWKYICIKCNICNAFKICFFLFSPPLYSLQAP